MSDEIKEELPPKKGVNCSNSKGKIGEAEVGEGEDEEEKGVSGSKGGGKGHEVGESKVDGHDLKQAAEGRKREEVKGRQRKGRILNNKPGENSDSDDCDNDSTEKTPKYMEKFKAVLRYKPFLELMINRLEKATDKTREAQLIKMQSLHDILFNPAKQLKLGTIRCCEKVLRGLYLKLEKRKSLPLKIEETVNEGSSNNEIVRKTSSSLSVTTEVVITTSSKTKGTVTLTDTPCISKQHGIITQLSSSSLIKEHQVSSVSDLQALVKSGNISMHEGVRDEARKRLFDIMNQLKDESVVISNNNKLPVPSDLTPGILNTSLIQTSSRNVRSPDHPSSDTNKTRALIEQPPFLLNSNEKNGSTSFTSNKAKSRWDTSPLEGENSITTDQVEKGTLSERSLETDFSCQKICAPVEQEYSKITKDFTRKDIEVGPIAKGNSFECANNKSESFSGTTSTSSFITPPLLTTSSFLASSFSTTSSFLNSTFTTTSSFLTSTHLSSVVPKFGKESFDTVVKKNNNSEPTKDTSENKPQSLREKLTEEISTVHKVGTSSGGALRGLLNRDDKTITTARMVNLKAGTIMDLIGKSKSSSMSRASTKPKPNFKKPEEEMAKLHDISLSKPSDQTPTNDASNPGILDLGFNSTNTLEEITKMDPKDLERIVNDHILKLPNSFELVKGNLPKEDFTAQNFSSENNRSFPDPRTEFTTCSSSNLPEYESPLVVNQNLQSSSSVSQFSPHAFTMQTQITNNFSQINPNFVYDLAQGNRPLYYNRNIEPDGFINHGVYTGLESNNMFNINQTSSSFSNYNNLAEHWNIEQSQQNTYSRNLEQNQHNAYSRNLDTNYQQNTFNQSNPFKWSRRDSGFENSSGYNVPSRSPYNRPYNSDRNLNVIKDCRNTGFEHRSRSLIPSQQAISTRDPRRRSLDGTANRTNSGRMEQPRNQRNDPRLYRNYNKHNDDVVSNRDPRVRVNSSSHHNYKYQEKKATKIESDFKTKLSAPPEKLHNTSEEKTIKKYNPYNYKIPKLRNNNPQTSDKKTNALTDKNSKSVRRNSIDEIDETKDRSTRKEKKETGEPKSKLKKDSSLDNRSCDKVTDDYDEEDEIKPVRNPRKRRHNWADIEDNDSCNSEVVEKEMSKKSRKKEDCDKLKSKVENDLDKKNRSKKKPHETKTLLEIEDKTRNKVNEEGELKGKKVEEVKSSIKSIGGESSQMKKPHETKTLMEIEDKTRNKVNEEGELKGKKVEKDKSSIKSIGEESSQMKKPVEDSSKKHSLSTANNCEGKTNIISETVVCGESNSFDKLLSDKMSAFESTSFQQILSDSSEPLKKWLPESLLGLIEWEAKTKFFSRLRENLNDEKMDKIRKIIDGNSDDEDVPHRKPNSPSVAGSKEISENKSLLPCNQDLEDSKKLSPCNQNLEDNKNLSPCNQDLEDTKKLSPCNQNVEDDKNLSPCNEDLEDGKHLSLCNQDLEDSKKLSLCNQDFEDNAKQTAKPVSEQSNVSEEVTNNKDEIHNMNLDLINEKESINENSSSLFNKMQEENKSIEEKLCFESISNFEAGMEGSESKKDCAENVNVEKIVLEEKDLQCLNKKIAPKKSHGKRKSTKRGLRKTNNHSKLVSSVMVDDLSLNEPTVKPKKKQKNELEKLQEDIRDMFISEEVVSATGLRQCRLRKLADGIKKEDCKEPGGSSARISREVKKGIKEKKTDLSQCSSSSSSSDDEIKINENFSNKITLRSSTRRYKNGSDVKSTTTSRKSALNRDKSNFNNKETDLSVEESVGSPVVILKEIDFSKLEKPKSEPNLESLLCEKENVTTEEDSIAKTELSYPVGSSLLSVQKERKKMVSGIKKKALAFSLKNKKFNQIKNQCKVFKKKESEKVRSFTRISIPVKNMNDDIYYFQRAENEIHSCKLCLYKGKVIVRHYVLNHHDEEVLISRLSPDSAKQAIEESEKMKFNELQPIYFNSKFEGLFYCRMCSRSFNKVTNFFDHMGYHTGEYRYHCKICTYKTSSKSGLGHHMMTAHDSYKKSIITGAYEDPPNADLLLGYLCSYCNYIQLFLSNLEKHIGSNHGHIAEQSIKAITINLSRPIPMKNKNFANNFEQYKKENIQLYPEQVVSVTNVTNELVPEIKIEEPSDISIMDFSGMSVDLNERFQEDNNTQLENIEPITKAEDSSNGQTPIDLEVFVGFENINPKDKDNELNIEREQIMNKIVSKLKNQTKSLKNSVLEHIKTKLTSTGVETTGNLQNNKKDSKTGKPSFSLDLIDKISGKSSTNEGTTCARRTLPRRLCKEKSQADFDKSENSNDSSELEGEIQKFFDEVAMSGSDNSEVDDLSNHIGNAMERSTTTKSAVKNKPIVCTITRLQDNLNRADTNLSENNTNSTDDGNQYTVTENVTETTLEISSQDINNDLLNFNCPISNLVCEDILPLRVGPLEICNLNSCTTYQCNYSCNYTSAITAEFIEHLQNHHSGDSSGWNGKCLECKTTFLKDGKRTFFPLMTAFRHLVESHVKQKTTMSEATLISTSTGQENIPPPPPAIPLANFFMNENQNQTSEVLQQKTPVLRLRRLSGDKLSVPAAENSLIVSNVEEEPIPVVDQEPNEPDMICYEDMENIRETNEEFTTTENDGCSFLRIESVVSLNPESAIEFHQDIVEERDLSESLGSPALSSSGVSESFIPLNLLPQPSTSSQTITFIPFQSNCTSPLKTNKPFASQDCTSTPKKKRPVTISRIRRSDTAVSRKVIYNLVPKPLLVSLDIAKKNKGQNTKTCSTNLLPKSIQMKKCAKDFKMSEVYEKMMAPRKLRDFYKCMGLACDFTCNNIQTFEGHYIQHMEASDEEDPEGAWKVCPYCYYVSGSVADYCSHMKKDHGDSFMQCAYCFYRSVAVENVLFHQNTCHITQILKVLQCIPVKIPQTPRIIIFEDYIKAYKCGEVKCKTSEMKIWTQSFLRAHAQVNHRGLKLFRCYICQYVDKMEGLFEHYLVHGLGMYQCLYCVHATATEDQIIEHLCYSHANQHPSALMRADNDPGKVHSANNFNYERFKRINFKEFEEKNHIIVPYVLLEDTSNVSNSVCQNNDKNVSNNIGINNSCVKNDNSDIEKDKENVEEEKKRGQEDDDIQIIETITKNDKITIITIESDEENVDHENILESGENRRKRPLCSGSSERETYSKKQNLPSTSQEEPPEKKCKDSLSKVIDSPKPLDIPIIPKLENVDCANGPDCTDKQSDDVDESNKSGNKIKKTGLRGKSLFRCGNRGCSFSAQDSAILKDHIVVCEYSRRGTKKYICIHCNNTYKQPSTFIEHIRTHGPARYLCSVCEFKAPTSHRVVGHMKEVHHIYNTGNEPMHPRKTDPDQDQFVCIPKPLKKKGKSKSKTNPTTPTKFSLSEIDKIPFQSIFPSPMGCSSCVYETKVRSNLVQHLALHAAGHSVPQEELVNPVPCLEKKEKMFDKMMNLAGSSHTNTNKGLHQAGKPGVFIPGFVPSNHRYMCHSEGCTYAAITDTMLKCHIETLHTEESRWYRCPHCPSSSSPVLMEKLSSHLKMHGFKLYGCSVCDYYHFSRYIVGKHVSKHVDVAVVNVIRENSVTSNNAMEEENGNNAVGGDNCVEPSKDLPNQNTPEKKNWQCNMCKFRSDDETSIRTHSHKSHGMATQFKCRLCTLESDFLSEFKEHFSKVHPNLSTQIITSFRQVTDPLATSSDNTNQPEMKSYWRRNSNTVRHIRGILIEEEESMEVSSLNSSVSSVNSSEVTIEGESSPTKPSPEEKFGSYGEPGPENEYQCPKCENLFKYRCEFQAHLYKELGYAPWLCTLCGRTARNKTTISKHIKVTHEREIGVDLITLHKQNQEIETWVNNLLSTQQSLMDEKSNKKGESVKNETITSPKKTKSTPNRNEDDLQRPPVKKRKQLMKNFFCAYCSTATVLKKSIKLHQLKKHPDLPLLILNLDRTPIESGAGKGTSNNRKTNKTQTNLDAEVDSRTDTEVGNESQSESSDMEFPPDINSTFYTCGYCTWTGNSISVLKKHWTLWHKNPVFLPTGAKKLGTGERFLCNQSRYSPDSEYVCSICQKQGSISIMKKHHLKDHVGKKFQVFKTNETEYTCYKCGLTMKTLGSLRKHNESKCIKIDKGRNTEALDSEVFGNNENIKIYKCPKCPFSKERFDLVVKHLAKHFQTFCCGVCNYNCTSALDIHCHMNSTHPGSSVKPKIVSASDSVESYKNDIIIHEVCNRTFAFGNSKDSEQYSGGQPFVSIPKMRSIKTKNISAIVNYIKTSGKKTDQKRPDESIRKLADACANYVTIDEPTENPTSSNLSDIQNGKISFETQAKTVRLNEKVFRRLFPAIHPKVNLETLIIHP